jgi:PhoPQ-activated pathogenicity-related protein
MTTASITTEGFRTGSVRALLLAATASLALAGCGQADRAADAAATAPATEAPADPGIIEVAASERTPLDEYVAKPESVYGWKRVGGFSGEGYTADVLELTSQTWRSAAEVDRPVWTHHLTVVRPAEITSNTALLYIGGGENGDEVPTKASDRAVKMALGAKTVVAELGMVPNQPLKFADTPGKEHFEDDTIAYTRVKHFATKDPEWLVRLAMVKSGVKAMDAVQEFVASEAGGTGKVDRFVVSGGSKRGWTSWLVAMVDSRVAAVMPLVIDALNSQEITKHHYEVLGFFAPSLGDYVNHGLFPHRIGAPEYAEVLKIEDPYNYRDRGRMRIPKYIINAAGDQYFHPDNSRFYYADLQQPKRLRYVANADHSLAGSDAQDSMLAFYSAIVTGAELPEYSWTNEADGSIRVTTPDKPQEVLLWQAHNPKTRDFRVEHLGKAYTSTVLQPEADGSYVARVEPPKEGFKAYFVELVFDSPAEPPFKFTTGVTISPDTTPFKWEDAAKQYADKANPENKPR